MKLVRFEDLKRDLLKDPEIKAEYDRLEVEYQIISDLIERRYQLKMTQKELAEKANTKQSAISRLESGEYNPSLKFLKKLAKALDAKLEVRIR